MMWYSGNLFQKERKLCYCLNLGRRGSLPFFIILKAITLVPNLYNFLIMPLNMAVKCYIFYILSFEICGSYR